MFNTNDFTSFVKVYFSHPFFQEHPTKKILHIVISASKTLREKKPELPWLLGIKTFKGSELYNEKTHAQIDKWVKRGCDLYYYVNYIEEGWAGAAPRNGDVQKRLWLPVDYDYRLPVTLKRIILDLQLRPAVVYRTSEVEGVKKYQGLWALDDLGKRPNTKVVKDIVRQWCKELGSDESVGNAARMLRLPGSYNWKTGVSRRDVKVIFGEDVKAESYYTYDDVLASVQAYHGSKTCKLVKAAIPRDTDKRPKLSDLDLELEGLSKSEKRAAKYEALMAMDWRDGLLAAESKDSSEKIAGTGHRHNLLTRWAGQLANEVGKGRLTLQEAKEVIVSLGYGAFEVSLGEAEVTNVIKWMQSVIEENEKARLEELHDALGLLDTNTTTTTTTTTGAEVESVPAGMLPPITAQPMVSGNTDTDTDKDDWGLLTTRRDKWSGELCDYQPELDGSIEGYQTFLGELLIGLNKIKAADGMTDDVVSLLLCRAEKMLLLHGGVYHLPERGVNACGDAVQWLGAVDGDRLEDHFGIVLQKLVLGIKKQWKTLRAIPEVQKELGRIESETRTECLARGITEEADIIKVVTARVKAFFDIKLSYGLRVRLCGELVTAISRLPEDGASTGVRNRWVGGEDIVFQNGIWSLSSAAQWRECWGWRLSQRSLWIELNVSGEGGVKDFLDVLEVGGLEGMFKELMEKCPLWTGFMQDTFPGDKGSWALWLLILGYSGLGTNRHQVIFSFIGLGGTGKSTSARIISGLIGRGASVNLDYERLAKEYEGIVHCVGKCLCVCDEAELAGGKKAHNEVFRKLKEITGGERVSVRGIYGRAFEAEIGTKFLVISNEQLDYSDASGAGKRRMVVMKFGEVVSAGAVDDKLVERIIGHEGKTIMAAAVALLSSRWSMGRLMWSIEGGSRAAEQGLAELEENTNPLGWFMKSVLSKGVGNNATNKGVPVDVLFHLCREYVEGQGVRGIKKKHLSDRALTQTLRGVLSELGEDPDTVLQRIRWSNRNIKLLTVSGWRIKRVADLVEKDVEELCNQINQFDYSLWGAMKGADVAEWCE